jgi:hypothetical protein
MAITKNIDASIKERLSTTGVVSKYNSVAIKIDLGTSLQSISNNVLLEDYAIVYADARPGVEDSQGREGWYFTNDVSSFPINKINWYFYDGTSENTVAVKDFSAYAVVTLDSVVSRPFFAMYTRPKGVGDIIPGFAHASRVFTLPSSNVQAGGKYVLYVGHRPCVFDDLPKIQLQITTTNGNWLEDDIVNTISFSTDSGAGLNTVKLLVEVLGVSGDIYSNQFGLRIRSKINASNEALVRALEFVQPLMYHIKNDSTGEIHAIVEASNFDAQALQRQIRSIGTAEGGYNFSNAVVVQGSTLTVE